MTAALLFKDHEVSPVELERRAACAAGGFDRLGIGEGDVVALMLYNEPAFFETMLACRRLGAYHCPINWHYKADEAGYILRDSGAKLLVANAEPLPQIEAAVPSIRNRATWRESQAPWSGTPRTPRGNMPYTSGTTGRPKGVRRMPASGAQRTLAMELYRVALGIEPGMRALLSAPLYHSAPNLYGLQALLAGECLALEPRFDAERTLALIARYRLTNKRRNRPHLLPPAGLSRLRLHQQRRGAQRDRARRPVERR